MRCLECGDNGRIERKFIKQHFIQGIGLKSIMFKTLIPVFECQECGETWEDEEADIIKDSMVNKYLSESED